MKINQLLSFDEIKALSEPSDLQGWAAVLFDWALIAGAFWITAQYPHPVTVVLAMIIMGGRQLGLGILVHECVHRSLFKTRALNDFVGRFLCGAPIWQDLYRYREHHIKHHAWAGTDKDPDLSLVSPFPVSQASLFRKCVRDILGISGLKRLFALLLMDFGFLNYTIAADPKPIDQSHKGWAEIGESGIKHIWSMITAQLLLFGILLATGHPWLYLLWVGSYISTFSLFLRIRSIAEHACMEMDLDPTRSTRTTYANPLARLTIAPHRVNFHLEHHLQMAVPYFKLPEFHALLRNKSVYSESNGSAGYWSVLKIATRKQTQSSPPAE